MFKVSLLPDSYRRHLQSRDKIDIVSKFALVILVCLFVVYGGFAIKNAILDSKLKKLSRENTKIQNEFPALQEYQVIYDSLVSSKNMVESVTPKNGELTDFLTTVANKTPEYVKINEIDLEDWFSAGVVTLTCTVQDYQDMKDYEAVFKTEEMQEIIKNVELTGIQRTVDTLNNKSVTFTLVLSTSGAASGDAGAPQYVTVTDDSGNAVTNDSGEVATTEVTTASN